MEPPTLGISTTSPMVEEPSARQPWIAVTAGVAVVLVASSLLAVEVPFPYEHTVDGAFAGARSVAAADVDGDGDLDLLGAASDADEIAWWENTAGDGSAWTDHTVDGAFGYAISVTAGDVDGDGDLDVLGAASDADDIAWWENRGGQFALATTDTAPATINDLKLDDLLAIEAFHRGRAGDTDLELASFELLLEETPGDPLTTDEANSLLKTLRIYLDADGSGTYGPADPMVASPSLPFSLDAAGILRVAFADGSSDVRVAFGTSRTYFVARKVQRQAEAAGGRVHILLGNHEVMNLTGNYRYVARESFADFTSAESAQERREGFRAFRLSLATRG